MEKLDGKTFDIVSDNIKKLEELFPEIVTEGKVDVDKLALLFDKTRNEDTDGSKDGEERYEFTWKGKKEAIRMAQKQTTGTLRPCREESVNFDETQNLYIEGDNLEVLRALQNSYRGKVKMIYIDPPYNTGKDFVYKDDFSDNVKNYKEKMNDLFKTNTDTSGRFHTNWLNMMYPRLKLARNILTDDGVIFISIDDNEVDNLRKICDEIFGENNFVAELVWANKEGGGGSDSKLFRIKHEYILCYAKSINNIEIFGVDINNSERYTLQDEYVDTRGKYLLIKLMTSSLGYVKSLDYPIESPDGTIIMPSDNANGKKSRWRWSKSKFEWGIKNGFVEIKKDSKGIWTVYTKQYMNCDNEGNIIKRTQRPFGIIEQYSSTQASKLLESLNLGKFFDYSKPVDLIYYLIGRICCNNDTVLDFFSGSSTTAHAVMQLNAEDGGNRKFIVVQLPEKTDEKSEAYKAGYENMCEIGRKRIIKAGRKIVEENKDKEGIDNLDIGFKVFKLDTTNIKEWDDSVQDTEKIKQMAMDLENPIKEDRSPEDIVYEILLKYGIDLTMSIEEVEIMGYKVYSVGFGYLMICLEEDINLDLIEAIGEQKPNRVVLYDNGLDNESKTNGERILKELGVKDIRTI